jgi:hypothetical protein
MRDRPRSGVGDTIHPTHEAQPPFEHKRHVAQRNLNVAM